VEWKTRLRSGYGGQVLIENCNLFSSLLPKEKTGWNCKKVVSKPNGDHGNNDIDCA